jgi:hypothetical protein
MAGELSQERQFQSIPMLQYFWNGPYHRFNEAFPRRGDGTRSLYIPDTEGEANRVMLESNRKSSIVEAPLAKSQFKKQH